MLEESKVISGRKKVKLELVSVAKLFMIACVAGAIAIILGVFFNSIALSVFVPLITMAAYIAKMRDGDIDIPITVVGDSFYYLGFIYTLVALVSSLVSLASNDNVNMNSVVGSFGAALTTTIVGLVARLVVTSFTVQARERRERLETEIERSLNTFSAQLDVLTTQVINSITKVHAETQNTLEENLKNYSKVQDDLNEEYKASMSNSLSLVKNSVEGIASRIQAIDVSSDIVSKPLVNSLEGIVIALNNHQRGYDSVNKEMLASNKKLAEEFKATGGIVQRHVDHIDSSINATISKQMEAYKANLQNISDALILNFGKIEGLKIEAQGKINVRIEQLSQEVDGVVSAIERIQSPVNKKIAELIDGSDTLYHGLKNLADASRSIQEVITTTKQSVSGTAEVKQELASLASAIVNVNNKLDELGLAGSAAASKVLDAANATEGSSHQVAKDIAEVYSQLALQIKALKGIS